MTLTLVLEIGSPWMKMAVFRTALGAYSLRGLKTFSVVDLSEDVLSKAIADFLKDLKIKKPQSVLISFSRNAVTLRNLRIPSTNPTEIDDMIKLHIGRQVPYAKEEIVSGYRVVGRDVMGYAKVMLAIVHRESIRKIFRILEKAGLYTDSVELSSDGVLAWLCKVLKGVDLKSPEAFIILDMDTHFTDFIVSTYENVLFSRVISQGREQLNDASKWAKFIGEMKQTIVISQGEEVLQKPSKIYLTGAVENLKDLSTNIEVEFNLPTQVVEPLANLPVVRELMKSSADIFQHASLTALLGLGFDPSRKKINFVLPEAQIRKTLKERSRDMMFFGSIAMYFILVVCGIYLEKMNNRQAYLDIVRDRYKKIATDAENLNEKVERIKKIKSKRDMKSTAINYLYEISKLLPPEITVVSLSFQQDEKVNLKGRAREMSDVFKLIKTVEDSLYFKDVESRYTTKKRIKDLDVYEFELICPQERETAGKTKEGPK